MVARRAFLGLGLMALVPPRPRAAPPPVPRHRLMPSFLEEFDGALSLYHPRFAPKGRWKTNYWFGDQKDYGGASSRSLPREKQFYADPTEHRIEPFRIRGGVLEITAQRAPLGSGHLVSPYADGRIRKGERFPYTSGLLTTELSFRQTYGYFEAGMAFPRGRGFWPAFWLLPGKEDYGEGQEIDVVEWVGVNPNRLVFTAHGPGNGGTEFRDGFRHRDQFHDYGLLWTADRLVWYVDSSPVRVVERHRLHRPMYLLINLAVGGWDGNDHEDPSAFPGILQVDYIRAFALR